MNKQGGNLARPKWPDERYEKLKELLKLGLSASKIAERLGDGVTRSAVLGKIHREKLAGEKPAPRAATPRIVTRPKLEVVNG